MTTIITVHGILSIKENWQPYFKSFLEVFAKYKNKEANVKTFYYGFVWPWLTICDWYIKRKTKKLEKLLSKYECPSVVAHSYGTWLLGHLLLKNKDIKLDKVIMAGSILPKEFPWEDINVNEVHNFCSKKDLVLEFADRLPGYGNSGITGFEKIPKVKNYRTKYDHNDYFPMEFFRWSEILLK